MGEVLGWIGGVAAIVFLIGLGIYLWVMSMKRWT
jgi:hypothetical protein